MKKLKSILFIITAVLLVVLVACGSKETSGNQNVNNEAENNDNQNTENLDVENLNKEGFPIVDEKITLKMFAGMSNSTKNNWDDILIWNTYEDMTGIHVEFEQTSGESLSEKRNLALASGTLPDVFYAAKIPPLDLFKYGSQGTFIPLNDLIEEYAPNLMSLMEENPEVRKGMTFPDGNIYSIPDIRDPDFTSMRTNPLAWVNEETLEHVDMENPETLDEFYDFLVAVQEDGPEGEVPLGIPNMNYLFNWLKGSYNVGNTGLDLIDKDPETGDVRFYAADDMYKELLEFINKLYTEELIEQNVFTMEWNQFLANATEGRYASTVFYAPIGLFGEEVGSKYIGGLPLEGPYGDRKWTKNANPLVFLGQFAVTNENEHPEASIRWIDHFYSDEGSELFFMGVEGETFEYDSDGNPHYLDKITDSADGLTKEQEISKYLAWVGIGGPAVMKQKYFDGSESSPQAVEAAEALKPYLIDEPWPNFTYTEEEAKVLSSTGADIEKYAGEIRDKFIIGEVPFSDWDEYVDTLESMGLDEYLEIQNAAYKRYLEN